MLNISIKIYIFFFILFTRVSRWFEDKIPFRIPTNKLVGMSYIELIAFLVETKFSDETLVVLTDINPLNKDARFWRELPDDKKIALTKDVVILQCKDFRHMEDIIDSIDKSFATALGFERGRLVGTNDY